MCNMYNKWRCWCMISDHRLPFSSLGVWWQKEKDFFHLEVLLSTLLWPEGRSVKNLCWGWVGSQRMEVVLLRIQCNASGVYFKGVLKGFVVSVFSEACVTSGLALVKQWRDGMAVLLWQDGGRQSVTQQPRDRLLLTARGTYENN